MSRIVEGVKKVSEAVRSYLVPGEVPVEIVTDQLALTLVKNQASQLANQTIDDGRGSVTLPDWCTLQADPDCSTDEIINLEVYRIRAATCCVYYKMYGTVFLAFPVKM